MTNMELLLLFGEANGAYIQEAQALRSGQGKRERRHLPIRKLWILVAAVVTVLALSATVYAAVSKIRLSVEPVPTVTQPAQEQLDTMAACCPQQIPEGYYLATGEISETGWRTLSYYSQESSQSIYFSLSTSVTLSEYLESYRANSVTSTTSEESVSVSGSPGTLFSEPEGWRKLVWEIPAAGCTASLATGDTGVELLAMAESVATGEPLPDRFEYTASGGEWQASYPQSLPEGYYCATGEIYTGISDITYYREEGDNSTYIQYAVSNSTSFASGDPPHAVSTRESVDIGGLSGTLTSIGDPAYQWELTWEDEVAGSYYLILSDDPSADLVAVAASVAPGEAPVPSEALPEANYHMEISQEQNVYSGFEPMYPKSLPEGYSVDTVGEKLYGQWKVTYKNAAGDSLEYTLAYHMTYDSDSYLADEPEQVDINGLTGYLSGQGDYRTLTWTDQEKGFLFRLWGSREIDLVVVAQSVAAGDELAPATSEQTIQALEQLGDYRITALPKGMAEDWVTGWPPEGKGDWYSYVRRAYYHMADNRSIIMEYSTYTAVGCGTAQDAANMFVSGDNSQPTQVQGFTAAASEYDGHAEVGWIIGDETQGVAFCLSSDDFTAAELLELAQSVEKIG